MRAEATGTTADLPRRRLGVADGGEQLRHVDVLQLLGPPPRQVMVEVLPGAAERLPQRQRLGPQPLGVRAGQLPQQLLVEGVAIDGDLLHQRGQRDGGIVGVGPVAADARAHQHRARQHGRLLEEHLLARQPAVVGQAVEHGVERHLLQHEPAAAARVVQLVHVPLAEEIVRPLVHRMVEVVRPRVEGQLVELFEGEHGVEQQRGIGGVENGQGRLDQFAIRARRGPRPANPQAESAAPTRGRRAESSARCAARPRAGGR